MPKNIIIFSDGTGQDGFKEGETPSNVFQLYKMTHGVKVKKQGDEFRNIEAKMKSAQTSKSQVSFYDPGVGTRDGFKGPINKVANLAGLAFGAGISENIKDCCEFICREYEKGDQIFLFGFSRGAATVRSLSGLIHLFGILPAHDDLPKQIKRIYGIYRTTNAKKRQRQADAFLKNDPIGRKSDRRAKITFLGVWDTVAMLNPAKRLWKSLLNQGKFETPPSNSVKGGWNGLLRSLGGDNNYHEFHDLSLSALVENACQALSIDERRKLFDPVLWTSAEHQKQRMCQVWFAGVHSDIGGGYQDHELADITLKWMMDRLDALTQKRLKHDPFNPTINACGLMHYEKYPGPHHDVVLGRYNFLRMAIPGFDGEHHWVHSSAFSRKSHMRYNPWILNDRDDRLPKFNLWEVS